MNHKFVFSTLLLLALFPSLDRTALASTTWYVNGVSGSDSNNCMSSLTACKTIRHTISLTFSGDSIIVAAATYTENLAIGVSLKILGSGATTTIIDGGGVSTVLSISNTNANVTLSRVTIRNGRALEGGGIYNNGTLTINNGIVTGNVVFASGFQFPAGGGIYNTGTLKISKSTLSGNVASTGSTVAFGGAIANRGTLMINRSTLSGNAAWGSSYIRSSSGGGIANIFGGMLTIHNSTFSGNGASYRGGGIVNYGKTLTISNSTFSGNSAETGGSIYGTATLQNSIVASSPSGGNCAGTMTSNGYNLSSDGTCNFDGPGDLNNHDPLLGPLQNNGGPTPTMALLSGSPAIDAGNPSGCTDGQGQLLKTDQRGQPRPDKEDIVGCDMGSFESQSD